MVHEKNNISLITKWLLFIVLGLLAVGIAGCQNIETMQKKDKLIIVLEPDKTDKVTLEELDAAKNVLRKRLDSKGLYDSSVSIDNENKRLKLEMTGVENVGNVLEDLGKTAKLQFKDAEGKVIIEESDIIDAKSQYILGSSSSLQKHSWVVGIRFSSQGKVKFVEATENMSKLAGQGKNYIGIYLDDQLISSPMVNERIESDSAIIEGADFTAKSTAELAALLRSGTLPFSLKIVSVKTYKRSEVK